MSWPLASFAIVGLVLVAGWLAYERRRPSARMAAVVAIMSALAALGRDAFAALPDVKPITAMTLVVGYSLGPLPGFAVGSLGMLVSNFMLGQGPYTPWQMVAWGMVGLAGALLGSLSRRRLGRIWLALACGLAALAAKEIMNVYTWTLGASHTPAAFIAVAGQALAYDVTDTVASFLFGLAFAPELARLLGRVRARMEVVWVRPPAASAAAPTDGSGATPAIPALLSLLGIAIAATLLLGGPRATDAGARLARPAAAPPSAGPAARPRAAGSSMRGTEARLDISRELRFLAAAQNPDGGFGGAPGQASSELYSGWVAMGLAAAGRDPLSLRRGGRTVLDFLRAEASSLHGAGDLERTILALHACGASTHSLPGADPVARLLGFRDGDGSFGHLGNLTAFAILALRAAGYPAASAPVHAAAVWLQRQQERDGGFGFGARGAGSDIDDTAAVLQALAGAGAGRAAIARAAAFLVRAQNRDGGYAQQRGGESNAQSTAWAIQGLTAAGRDVAALTRDGSRSPLGYLHTLLAPNGSVRYSRTGAQTPVWVTAQALTALAEKPLPIAPVRSSAARGGSSGRAVQALPSSAHGSRLPRRTVSGRRTDAEGVASRRLDGLARALGTLLGIALAPVRR
ncbi:MAG TPA: prenyltransferase/squalene oxidase repeat-containing protein [Solirubrobacteraceae bacterium]